MRMYYIDIYHILINIGYVLSKMFMLRNIQHKIYYFGLKEYDEDVI